jgi:quercetin dioxygenase-like cupin family protein
VTSVTAPSARRGEVYENPVTGERAVVRVGTDETRGERLEVDLYVRPRGAVAAKHWHPAMRERFTVVSGRVAFTIDGREALAAAGHTIEVPPGVSHDWWNAGEGEAHVIVEVQTADRFVACVRNVFGLAQDGRTNAKGLPRPMPMIAVTSPQTPLESR